MRVGCNGLFRQASRPAATAMLMAGLLAILAVGIGGRAVDARAATPTIRISTENTADHVQTRVLRLFAERLQDRLDGRVTVEVHDSAALFRGRDVVEAVAAGRVDVAAPGMWHLDRYEPDFAVFLLPMFYGREDAMNHAIRDGAAGRSLNTRLEAATGVHVLGRWIDLGRTHLFTRSATIEGPADIKGLRLRVAGGEGNAARIRALGAEAVLIPWPDLPPALEAGSVDGTLTSAGTVVSASLWTRGIDGAYLDSQYFAQYVPIVSPRLWARLPDDVRTAMTETWDAVVEDGRALAAAAQKDAVARLEAEGVRIVRPSSAVLAETRADLMTHQPGIVRALGLDPALVEAVRTALER
ncbi:TRAP transporter substrate-binding protein DctP [Caenispirillum salinarum]|uniref:TRAP transporter substrate-binding protein DctP n=1 Tax=Caenispirillum salinarum TaxID=859058 RepID=UPI00384E427F